MWLKVNIDDMQSGIQVVGPLKVLYTPRIPIYTADTNTGLEFRQKIYLSDGQVDLQNHLSVMKSTCPTQENQKI